MSTDTIEPPDSASPMDNRNPSFVEPFCPKCGSSDVVVTTTYAECNDCGFGVTITGAPDASR